MFRKIAVASSIILLVSIPATGQPATANKVGPKSKYCDAVAAQLDRLWTIKPRDTVIYSADWTIDRQGNIISQKIGTRPGNGGQPLITDQIRRTRRILPPPPGFPSPTPLSLAFSREFSKPQVSMGGIEFDSYMAELQRKIKSNWHPPKMELNSRVLTRFKLWRDGHITEATILSQGDPQELRDACLFALSEASAAPLPDGSPEYVDVEFTFDYNVFHHRP